MAVKDWSTSASSNTSVGGITIAPGMARSDVDNAIRSVMAEAKAKFNEVVTVTDFPGVDITGASNSAVGIQAAFDSGAKKVIFPKGLYLVTGDLTVPDWLHIEGASFDPGSPDTRAVEIRFAKTTGSLFTCGDSPTIKNIWFSNTTSSYDETAKTLSGTTAAAITLTGSATIEECSFAQFYKCVVTGAETYYLKTERLQFNRCTYGYYAPSVTPYNMHIGSPCSILTNIFLAGASTAYPRNVKVFGGSIEGWDTVATHFQEIDFFGTYFETEAPRSGEIAIEPGVNGAHVGLYGCHINVSLTARFVNLSGLTNCTIVSHGNTLYGAGPVGGYYVYLPSTGNASMAGDNFTPDPTGSVHALTYRYVDAVATATAMGGISMPLLPDLNDLGAYSKVNFTGAPAGSATYDPGSLADGAGATTTVTVTGAALGDFAQASFSLDLQGITLTAWVSAANTVSVRFQNETGGLLDLASGTLKARTVRV